LVVLCAVAGRGAGSTIVVPTVTISQLTRTQDSDFYRDAVTIPGPGYSSSGFTAAVSTGDVVDIHFEAPPGKMFAMDAPAGVGIQYFFLNAYWQSNADAISFSAYPHTLTFENLQGTMPTQTRSLNAIGDHGNVVVVQDEFTVGGAFTFTGIEITITASQPLGPLSRSYGSVQSYSSPSWGASASLSALNPTLLEIVDIAVPTQRTTWGRMKSQYR
jgi:hypothetical protein